MVDNRIRLVVLFGGRSAEHDVSCVSARHVVAAADSSRYQIVPVGITREGRWVMAEAAAELLQSGAELPAELTAQGPPVDAMAILETAFPATTVKPTTVVFPVLHGPMGEDGTIQGLLELADVPYVGAGVLASALCMDKAAAKQHLAQANLPQAAWIAATATDIEGPNRATLIDQLIDQLGLPLYVKPANMGSSVGVSRAADRDAVGAALDLAAGYDEMVVIEEEIKGREIEVAVLGNESPRPSLPGEIVPGAEFYDYADKYEDGAQIHLPAPLTETETAEVQELAIAAYRSLRVEGLARVDFFLDPSRGWLVNELNTMPGFTPISMYPKLWDISGLAYSALIDELIGLALARHQRHQAHRRTDHT